MKYRDLAPPDESGSSILVWWVLYYIRSCVSSEFYATKAQRHKESKTQRCNKMALAAKAQRHKEKLNHEVSRRGTKGVGEWLSGELGGGWLSLIVYY